MKHKYNILCEFGLKITPVNLTVWRKKEGVINITLTSSNNNNIPRSNLGTKCKVQNHKHKIKREEKQPHQKIFTQFSSTMTYSRGRLISQIYYQ